MFFDYINITGLKKCIKWISVLVCQHVDVKCVEQCSCYFLLNAVQLRKKVVNVEKISFLKKDHFNE